MLSLKIFTRLLSTFLPVADTPKRSQLDQVRDLLDCFFQDTTLIVLDYLKQQSFIRIHFDEQGIGPPNRQLLLSIHELDSLLLGQFQESVESSHNEWVLTPAQREQCEEYVFAVKFNRDIRTTVNEIATMILERYGRQSSLDLQPVDMGIIEGIVFYYCDLLLAVSHTEERSQCLDAIVEYVKKHIPTRGPHGGIAKRETFAFCETKIMGKKGICNM